MSTILYHLLLISTRQEIEDVHTKNLTQSHKINAQISSIEAKINVTIYNAFLLLFRIHLYFFPRKYKGIDKIISKIIIETIL